MSTTTTAKASDAPLPGGGFSELLQRLSVAICVGSGGVGKTTSAAALGLLAARGGRTTLVLTIDPARRLAVALGLDSLEAGGGEVPAERLAGAGVAAKRFYARMLEPKRTFDAMVRRYAPSEAAVQAVMRSKLYRQMSTRLAGSQEYAAMETLHQLHDEGAFDLLILDTPPAANALDFLEAPRKMVEAVESPAVSLFIKAYQESGRLSLNMLGLGASYVVRRLARFTGSEFINDIAGFLSDLSGLLGGMQKRAAQVEQMLGQPELGFVVVTSPDPRAVDEAIDFCQRLKRAEMRLAGFVINRVHPHTETDLTEEELAEQVRQGSALEGEQAKRLAEVLRRSFLRMESLAEADRREIQRLKETCGEGPIYVEVPLFSEDIFDIAGLVKLGAHLG